jgi:hypothetical protein
MDNATAEHKKSFWKKAAKLIQKKAYKLESNQKIYVSTHGTGVDYFHLRVDMKPEYYSNNTKRKLNIST